MTNAVQVIDEKESQDDEEDEEEEEEEVSCPAPALFAVSTRGQTALVFFYLCPLITLRFPCSAPGTYHS
jgi:hypothetical protein